MGQLRVTEAFVVFSKGSPHGDVYPPGLLVDEKDPVVKGREKHFEPADLAAQRVVRSTSIERATAAPGEKRYVTLDRYKTGPEHGDKSGDPNRGGEPRKADGEGGLVPEGEKPKRTARKRAAKRAAKKS